MNQAEWTKSFYTATHLLPERLWRGAFTLSAEERITCEEIRLRAGKPLVVVISGKNRVIRDGGGLPLIVQAVEIEETLMRMTRSSVHTYLSQLMQGFFTTEQGHRVGVCGETVCQNGQVSSLRSITSVNIRIAKECKGVGEELLLHRMSGESVLVISPPGGGKTTLLRDLARLESRKYRISIVDERFELAASMGGQPRFDIGLCDVLSGCKKREGIEMLLRCMNPEIIVVDEITRPEDCDAMLEAWGCGCDFFATAHGKTVEELYRRPIYRKLLDAGAFHHFIVISCENGARAYREQRGAVYAEAIGRSYDCECQHIDGNLRSAEIM